jgi:hypothetical protein
MTKSRATAEHAESAYAWTRLFAALLLSTIGGVGMWSVIVALPAVQAEFGVARSDASLPYTMTMIGVGVGGVPDGSALRSLRDHLAGRGRSDLPQLRLRRGERGGRASGSSRWLRPCSWASPAP